MSPSCAASCARLRWPTTGSAGVGTNYYLHTPRSRARHIGKSSAGWCFGLHVYPGEIETLENWRSGWSAFGVRIADEYCDPVTPEKMLTIITARSWPRRDDPPAGYDSWADFYHRNHAMPGPNGLVRRQIDGRHCIGHGPGPWDLLVGDFC